MRLEHNVFDRVFDVPSDECCPGAIDSPRRGNEVVRLPGGTTPFGFGPRNDPSIVENQFNSLHTILAGPTQGLPRPITGLLPFSVPFPLPSPDHYTDFSNAAQSRANRAVATFFAAAP